METEYKVVIGQTTYASFVCETSNWVETEIQGGYYGDDVSDDYDIDDVQEIIEFYQTHQRRVAVMENNVFNERRETGEPV